jgi:hypothetical protein
VLKPMGLGLARGFIKADRHDQPFTRNCKQPIMVRKFVRYFCISYVKNKSTSSSE